MSRPSESRSDVSQSERRSRWTVSDMPTRWSAVWPSPFTLEVTEARCRIRASHRRVFSTEAIRHDGRGCSHQEPSLPPARGRVRRTTVGSRSGAARRRRSARATPQRRRDSSSWLRRAGFDRTSRVPQRALTSAPWIGFCHTGCISLCIA